MTKDSRATETTPKIYIFKQIFGFLILFVIIFVFGFAIFSTNTEPSNAEKVWDESTIVGNLEAKNYFIIYSDIMCPYCVAFENAILENEAAFEKYIQDNDILIEVRLSDFLYEYGEAKPINSRYAAEATYCAKKAGKFWDYYKLAITTVWNDYFKTLGKAAFTKLNQVDKDYWIKLGQQINLDDDFVSCVKNDETLEEIITNAGKTAKLVNGMPYFKFNSYTNSGFSLSWGWEYVQMYFQAGLDSKKS
ncbi:thioredoxin domain-containing protein [Candidatus Saccharibacteria bacterium]|nr:thioredoxin domain-containing protein [Candidatus Saccharibacteria bacterium]